MCGNSGKSYLLLFGNEPSRIVSQVNWCERAHITPLKQFRIGNTVDQSSFPARTFARRCCFMNANGQQAKNICESADVARNERQKTILLCYRGSLLCGVSQNLAERTRNAGIQVRQVVTRSKFNRWR